MLGLPRLRKRLGVTARSRATLPVKRTVEGTEGRHLSASHPFHTG